MGVSENLCSFLKGVKPHVLYSVKHGIAMEPMKEKRVSSRVDLGYTELFCIPEVHQCSSHLVTVFLRILWCSIKKIEAPYVFNWVYDIALHEMQGNQTSSPAKCMCHGISRVAEGTWGIFSSYSGDGHSKLHFVQQSQNSSLVTTDTSGI